MEHNLILVVVVCVFVAVLVAVIEWFGWKIPEIVKKVGGILIVGILVVMLIKFLWPFLMA